MKQVKQIFLVFALMMMLVNVGWGQLLNENFNYTTGTLLTANGWNAHSGAGTNPITVGASSITYPGYLSSGVGNEISMLTSGEDDNKTFTSQTSGTVYASCLINITSATTTGDYFFHFGPSTIGSTFQGRVFLKKDASNNLAFGVSRAGAVATAIFTPFSYALNTTYLLVLKYTIVAGTLNDVAAIYINPTLNAVEPVTGWTASTDNTVTDLANVGSIALRQGGTSSPTLKLDGIRVSTTWADIVGAAAVSAPTIQASNITFSNVISTGMKIDWTNGDGSNRAVFVKETSGAITNPSNGTTYTASSDWSLKGTQLGSSGYYCVYNGTGTTVSLTNLSASTSYYVQVFEYNGTGATSNYLTTTAANNPNNTTTLSAAVPTKLVITSVNSGNIVQVNPSTFSITIQAQDNSNNPQNVKTNTDISLSVTTGTGSITGTTTGTFLTGTNTITISGISYSIVETGVSLTATATSGMVLANGTSSLFTVYSQIPSNQPTNLIFSSIGVNGFNLTYTAATGSPDGYLVLRRPGSSYPTGVPSVGTEYTVGATIGDGTVAYSGNGLTFLESALTSGTQYSYSIFSYNGTGATINYITTTPLQNQQYTMFAEPTVQTTNVTFTNVSGTGFTINWINGDGSNRLVLVKSGSAVDADPADGNYYTSSTTFGNGSQIGTGNYVVYNFTGSSVNVTGLTEGTDYYVSVFEYNGGSISGGVQNYFLTTPATGNQIPSSTKYYSIGTGDPAVLTNWKTARDGSGSSPADFTTPATFIIQGTHILTTTSIWSFGGAGSILEIENGGSLQSNFAITIASGATFKIDNGGTYIHNNTVAFGSSIFQGTESFASNSTVEFRDWNSTGPNVTAWGNVKFNATGAVAGSMQLSGNMTTINGNFDVIATGSTPREIRFTTGSQPTIYISGNFTQSGGIVNLANTVGSSVTVLNIAGNFAVNGGTFTSTSTGSKVVFNGTTAQTFTNAGTINVANFEINNSAGLVLNSELNISGALTLTNGKITLGANNLIISNTAISGANSSNYIVTNGTGVLKINNISTLRIFPVGTESAYSPAWISNSGTIDNFSVNVEPDATGSNSGEDRVKLKWNISEEVIGGSIVTLKLGWLTSQEGTNFANNRSTYSKLHHLTGGSWVLAGSGNFVNQFTTEPYTTEVDGITSFSPFASGFNDGSLPVSLSSLNSSVIGRGIKLNWTTASEVNNSGFEIERKTLDGSFAKIGYVSGHGTVNTPTNYSFEDKNLQTGKYKYRLKQIDNNGNFEYFALNGEVEIGVPKKFDLSQNYPNPFNPVTKINFDLPENGKVDLRLYDMLGREVATLVNEVRTAGYYTVNFNASSLSSGIYFYRMNAGKFSSIKKMAVIK